MIVKQELSYEKDVAEVCQLLVSLVDCIKNKKDYAILIPSLISAIEGASTIPASFEADKATVIGTFTYEAAKILDVLVK